MWALLNVAIYISYIIEEVKYDGNDADNNDVKCQWWGWHCNIDVNVDDDDNIDTSVNYNDGIDVHMAWRLIDSDEKVTW